MNKTLVYDCTSPIVVIYVIVINPICCGNVKDICICGRHASESILPF